MEPRPVIESIMENSPVSGKLKPGDVVEAITINGEMQRNPTVNSFTTQIRAAARENHKVDFLVQRKGEQELQKVFGVVPDFRTGQGIKGIGVHLVPEEAAIVANVMQDSPAARAGVPRDSVIQKINGKPVSTWFDVNEALKSSGGTATITAARLDPKTAQPMAESTDFAVALAGSEIEQLKNIRYTHELYLRDRIEPRK